MAAALAGVTPTEDGIPVDITLKVGGTEVDATEVLSLMSMSERNLSAIFNPTPEPTVPVVVPADTLPAGTGLSSEPTRLIPQPGIPQLLPRLVDESGRLRDDLYVLTHGDLNVLQAQLRRLDPNAVVVDHLNNMVGHTASQATQFATQQALAQIRTDMHKLLQQLDTGIFEASSQQMARREESRIVAEARAAANEEISEARDLYVESVDHFNATLQAVRATEIFIVEEEPAGTEDHPGLMRRVFHVRDREELT